MMGVCIQEYRFRIGSFLPKARKLVKDDSKYHRNYLKLPCNIWVLLLAVSTVILLFTDASTNRAEPIKQNLQLKPIPAYYILVTPVIVPQVSCYWELSNFYARYLYGNKQPKGIKIAHFNKGQGYLASKKHEIGHLISELSPHVLGISEANFFKNHCEDDVQFKDYNFHKCPTLDNPDLEYSRIIIYTHKSLICKPRTDLMSDKCSSIWLQIGLPNQKQILVCQFYREWQLLNQNDELSQSVQAQLQRWLNFLHQWEQALLSGLEVIVLGDMNINHLDWSLPIGCQSSQTKKLRPLIEQLFTRIFPHSVSQCVTVPTRFWPGQAPTGLDHFYTNHPEKLSVVQSQFFGGSDHKVISATRFSRMIKSKARYVHKRCYKYFDISNFLHDLSKISWWDVYNCNDVDLAVGILTSKFIEILDHHAPMRTIQSRSKYVPWLSDKTKELMNKRNDAQREASVSQSPTDWNKFKKLRNEVTKLLRSEEKNWQQNKLISCSGKASEQWQYVMKWLGWKSCATPSQLFYNGRLITKPSELADCQNEYFVNKVKLIQENLPPSISDPLSCLKQLMRNHSSTFQLKCVHPEIVENIVKGLKNSKSAGMDNIDTQILKLSLSYVLPALTHIINLSILNGHFPTQWKIAKIIPLYKKEDPLDPKNYRPVAILPVLSKVFECVIFLRVSQYMELNQLTHPNHHGFRSLHSTATCLIQMYDKWVEATEEKKYTGVCLLDLSAAFDIVDHSLLLEKLKLYGFDVMSVNWIKSYLDGRQQSVYIDGKMSKVLPLSAGVPQGSILGPLLYTIFTNELPEVIHNHNCSQNMYNMHCEECGNLCCYADDSTFSVANSDLETISSNLSNKYSVISKFMGSNRLKLNDDKTHLMLLSTDKAWRTKLSQDSLLLRTEQNVLIRTSNCEKLLGGVVSQNFKWTEHILLKKIL